MTLLLFDIKNKKDVRFTLITSIKTIAYVLKNFYQLHNYKQYKILDIIIDD